MNTKSQNAFMILATLFLTILLVSNIIAQKTVSFFGYTTAASLVVFPLVYIIANMITEVWGAAKTRMIIWLGLLANIVMAGIFELAIYLPGSAAWIFRSGAFNETLGIIWLTVAASMVAYLIGTFSTTAIISKMKLNHKGQNMVLRFILGNLVGTLLDSVFFVSILHYSRLTTNSKAFFMMILIAFLIKWAYTIVGMIISVPVSSALKRNANNA